MPRTPKAPEPVHLGLALSYIAAGQKRMADALNQPSEGAKFAALKLGWAADEFVRAAKELRRQSILAGKQGKLAEVKGATVVRARPALELRR